MDKLFLQTIFGVPSEVYFANLVGGLFISKQTVAPSCWRAIETASSGLWIPLENFLAPSTINSANHVLFLLPIEPPNYWS